MSGPLGEGAQPAANFDELLNTPTYKLMEPKTAPPDMLDQVRINTQGQCLETDTSLGTIAVEMYWTRGEHFDGHEQGRGSFFPALESEHGPDADASPLATQKYPYTVLPDGALYQVAVRVPLSAVDATWSEERTRSFGDNKLNLLSGVTLSEFRRAFPGVKVDLPEGRYTISAQERTKAALIIAARVENGEPLTRTQEVIGSTVCYTEAPCGGFMNSELRPDTAIALIDSRTTLRPAAEEADSQRLEFRAHDGFQRTGEGAREHSGLVELIVMQSEAVQYSGFTFAPYQPPIKLRPSHTDCEDYSLNFGHGFIPRRESPSFRATPESQSGGLTGGETRYRPPEVVKVSMAGVRDLRVVAAFRFAMTANQE